MARHVTGMNWADRSKEGSSTMVGMLNPVYPNHMTEHGMAWWQQKTAHTHKKEEKWKVRS